MTNSYGLSRSAATAFFAVIMSGEFIVTVLGKPETDVRGMIGWVAPALSWHPFRMGNESVGDCAKSARQFWDRLRND